MNRQELLLNLFLLTLIAALTLLIMENREEEIDLYVPTVKASDLPPPPETTFDVREAMQKYPTFGNKPIFQAIITPTPTPPPPTPTPTRTPDVNAIFAAWKLMSVDEGEATIEDRSKTQSDPEHAVFTLRVGQTMPVEVERGVFKNAILKRVDAASDNPSITLGLEGIPDQKILRMFDEAQSGAPQ
ncbi:MAG: hypothetical protein D6691_07305 [Candidatus Hydrogenedentota bacterium]|uniref:Uncharacterized protein n=1 Tax=Sumerlaea chitinivorans TaxID=2250252 RepID=A0A2Z4Y5I6_SUMC1|nr:hypothetical protein BRCON_1643 [Candidatus Sumerlaea chitinivorans]RMH26970.1 MAG: hypothetical protein D6691_07305 [Candidatus Hydrogenedentota bacterium]GIX45746.1 MAG: hypothetical protein KatS3mg130_2154 [Candidatus Sumerlaea sp.]